MKPAPRRLALAALLTAALPAALPLRADVPTWKIDASHSDVSFRVKHLVISRVAGQFGKFEGTVVGDPKAPAAAKVELKIETASIDTKDAKRDAHLRSADFFDAEKHPEIAFTSTRIVDRGNGAYDILGNLTMRGVTKPVTLSAKNTGFVTDPWGNERAGFEASGRLNRQEWGVSWSKKLDSGGLVVDDDVDLIVNLELVKQKPAAPKG